LKPNEKLGLIFIHPPPPPPAAYIWLKFKDPSLYTLHVAVALLSKLFQILGWRIFFFFGMKLQKRYEDISVLGQRPAEEW
jgi:hypothetical protein